MFGRRFELFRVFGFAIRLDLSWFLVALLVAWSLATGVFPQQHPDLSTRTYWIMGVVGALALFASVVLHELAHSLVARHHGVEMKGITLFLFGGVAEMTDEPPSPKAEFQVAAVGPLASVLIGAVCLAAMAVAGEGAWPEPLRGVVGYLGLINLLLAAFNVVPAFPLDGGRVLRSILWRIWGDLRKATRVTSRIGSGFGVVLLLLGVWAVLVGNFVAGVWWFMIGLFLRGAAQMSYRQLLIRQLLEGEPVRRFMNESPVSVSRSIPVEELVEDYVYRHHFKMFPVVEGDRLVGCVTTGDIKELPREEWGQQSTGAIARECSEENTAHPDEDAIEAFTRMSRSGNSRLMVVEDGKLVGVLTLKDLAQFFSRKLELEGAEG